MAQKKEQGSEPIISSIPVPPSDSALVIDLPDGQKLLVGKIETGTVIEVATWRGTGRPDSRTNRLMLGMSNEADAKKQEAEAANNADVNAERKSRKRFPANIPYLILGIFTQIRPIVFRILKSTTNMSFTFLKKIRNKNKEVSGRTSASAPSHVHASKSEDDFEVDFQRILDEVNERRTAKKSKGIAASGSKKVAKPGVKKAKTDTRATPKKRK